MSTRHLMAEASRFAHLAGLTRGRAAADDSASDQDKDRDEAKKAKKADDDGDEDGEAKKADAAPDSGDDGSTDKADLKKAKASDEDDVETGDDEDDGDTDPKKGKRAAEDDDDKECDDDPEEMTGKSAAARARRRERARCAAIFAEPRAADNPELAASLAFETELPRAQAIKVLRGQRAQAAPAASRRNPDLGAGGSSAPPSRAKAVAESWDVAFRKAGRGA